MAGIATPACAKEVSHREAEGALGHAVRVYDLRHRFATAAVQRWLDDGSDLNAKLPFLHAYMGHTSFAQTAYYIHLLPANLTQSNAVDWAAFDTLIPEV